MLIKLNKPWVLKQKLRIKIMDPHFFGRRDSKTTRGERSRITKFMVGFFVLSFMLSMTVQPLVFSAFAAAAVTIDTINGQPVSGHCITGPITIVGHGTRGTNGGPYSLDINWGDGSIITTISVGSGANGAFY